MERNEIYEIEITEGCMSPFNITINGKDFKTLNDRKEFLINFISELEDQDLERLFHDMLFYHPGAVDETLEVDKCDQCGDYNTYEKFILHSSVKEQTNI